MRKIRRKCKCGCREITNFGKKYVWHHYWVGKKLSEETKRKISLSNMGKTPMLGKKHSEKTKKKITFAAKNISKETREKMSKSGKGRQFSKEHKRKLSLALIKYNPNYPYCDIWKDKEYIKDLRKDYCENVNCKRNYKRLHNHHIYLDKKRCAPNEIMTLCAGCHTFLHNKLSKRNKNLLPTAMPQDYIIINRPDHISYIHKASREIIKIKRRVQN